MEKIATALIKNLQIDISDVHIRFEDTFSCPSNPFACGITLKKLNFVVGPCEKHRKLRYRILYNVVLQTTGEDWHSTTAVSDAWKFVYKVSLD